LAEVAPKADWWWLDRTTTFTTTSGTRDYTPITTNVSAFHSFTDVTNNRLLDIISATMYDDIDPDQDDSGTIEAVYIGGIDPTANEFQISLWRTPSNSSTSIRIRYRADIDEFTASDDGSDFLSLGIPRIIENVITHHAASLYLEEEGDMAQAGRESQRQYEALGAALEQNGNQQGNRRYPPIRNRRDDFVIRHGTDAVVVS
tara:strand:- start:3493 stop:4098 length:606 start_codon:yes stop_codon:yes gene_type:complete